MSTPSYLRLLVTNALILDVASRDFEPYFGYLAVDTEGKIAAIGAGEAPSDLEAAETLDATGKIIAPGFVSAHSHLFTSASRGLGVDESLYGWIVAMTQYTDHCEAEDIYYMTKHGAVDFLRNGITTAYDFVSNGAVLDKEDDGHATFDTSKLKPIEFQESQFLAKIDAGIRFINSFWLTELETEEATHARLDGFMEWAKQYDAEPLYLRMALSGTVQWATHKDTARLETEAMQRHGLINQPHFLETPHNIEGQQEKFWWYEEAGTLGKDLIFGHFIQTTDEIIQTAARCGCGAVWQPTSNGRLASGVAAVPKWREAGMRVGVGLDDQSCTDLSDPFQNMRIGIYTQRATHKDPKVMGAKEMLYLHTQGGAETLQVEDRVGSLEVGKFADFLVVNPNHPDTGPIYDPIGTYVFACGLRNLEHVYIGGECRTNGSEVLHLDMAALSEEVHTRMNRIRSEVTPEHPMWTSATLPGGA